jgi:hypothetical protein
MEGKEEEEEEARVNVERRAMGRDGMKIARSVWCFKAAALG